MATAGGYALDEFMTGRRRCCKSAARVDSGKVAAHIQATNERPPRGQLGSELVEPPGQEPPLGGRGGQLQRPAVRRPGLVVAAQTTQQLAAGRVEIEVAVQVEPVDSAQRRDGV